MRKFLRTFLTICLLLRFSSVLVACNGNANAGGNTNGEEATFTCTSKTFVYDKWDPAAEISEDDRPMIEAMMQINYANTEFVFDAEGNSCVWRKIANPENITFSGTWEIFEDTITITKADEGTETLHIDGLKFYYTQAGPVDLNIYFKLA